MRMELERGTRAEWIVGDFLFWFVLLFIALVLRSFDGGF
jgi:hypothetical protein